LQLVQKIIGLDPTDISVQDGGGNTPLHLACRAGHEAIVRILIAAGARTDMRNKQEDVLYPGDITPLYEAAGCGHLAVVKLLTNDCTDPQFAVSEGTDLLFYLTTFGLQHPITVDSFPEMINKRAAVIKYLLDKDVSPIHRYGTDFKTLLHFLAEYHPLLREEKIHVLNLVGLLIEKGAEVDACDRLQRTPLITLCSRTTEETGEDIAQVLITSNADVTATDRFQWTALHHAAKNRNLPLIKLLVARGASVLAKTKDGATPLFLAMHDSFDSPTVTYLRERSKSERDLQ
jgi:ankyrin